MLLSALAQLSACLIVWNFHIPNPNILLFVVLSAVLVKCGYAAGIVSGFIAFLYSAFFFSTDHSFFLYTSLNFQKLIVIGVGIAANILLIGRLQWQFGRSSMEKMQAEAEEKLQETTESYRAKLYHDVLTGTYNRRYYEDIASRIVGPAGIALIDVDDFKICNDTYGHYAGDMALETAANAIRSCIRDSDLLIRYGGHAMAAGLSVREENLEALRRRLNEWAARECPVLQIPPLTCDLSIHLDRVTVDAVRRLDQLAPFGAENPTPVFLLQNAVLDGVYPVSDGKHSRLRLRQGNASLYAVWFGMRPEQLPYATGDVVDTALNLSVYDAPRGAQLSGRIIDLHPAGLGSAMPQQAALVQALRRGTPLTTEQKNLITPARSDIIAVYRELQARRWHAEDLQPLCAKLGEENTGKTLVAVTALEQVGLIAAAEKGGAKVWELVPTAGKKNLADAPILKCLEGM